MIWGFRSSQNNAMKICSTEITENHYKKEEYQKKQIIVTGGCHLDGHILLKTGKPGYKLSALPEKASDW